MRVFDGFTFNDELDLLELRLETLKDVVDTFVLVEFPVSFRRNTKPLHFSENKDRFRAFIDRIRVVSPTEFPTGPHPEIEHCQRRRIRGGLWDAAPGDLVLVGDVDEIPDPLVIQALKDEPPAHPMTFRQFLYYYYVDTALPVAWKGTVAAPWGVGPDFDAEKLRQLRHHFPCVDGGWHFSWLGSSAQINSKLACIDVRADVKLYPSDIICPKDGDIEFIEACRSGKTDIFGRNIPISQVPIEPGLRQPASILPWLSRFPHYSSRTP